MPTPISPGTTHPSDLAWTGPQDARPPKCAADSAETPMVPEQSPALGAFHSSVQRTPKATRAVAAQGSPGSGSGTSANIARLRAILRSSDEAQARPATDQYAEPSEEAIPPESDWVVDESSWEAAFPPSAWSQDESSEKSVYPASVTWSVLSKAIYQRPPAATPVLVPGVAAGSGLGLPNLYSYEATEDLDAYFASFVSAEPYTMVQLPAHGHTPAARDLQKVWEVLSNPSGQVKFVIDTYGQLVVGDEGSHDGLKHYVLANYIPGMERWTPLQRWDHLKRGVPNHNVVAAGALKLTDDGHGRYRLGDNNESGHFKPGPDSLWHGRVRTELQRLANGLKTHLNIHLDVGMQTDELRDGAIGTDLKAS